MTPLKVWSRFSKVKDGTEIKCRIQEVSVDYHKELLFDLFVKYFLPDEPMNQAVGIPDNALAVNEFKEEMLKNFLLDENSMIDVCLVEDGSNEEIIAGASIIYLAKKSDPIPDPNQLVMQTEEMSRLFSILTEIENTYDVFEGLKEDSYFSGKGMVVDPKYRGLGIAGEFLKARWLKEYLPDLQNRREPHGRGTTFRPGDLVDKLVDENQPRNQWTRGKIVATFPGPDGIVRTVDVITKTGTLRRPVRKLVTLEMERDGHRPTRELGTTRLYGGSNVQDDIVNK